jgi:deoxyribodipyrimidine photolyase-related protein
MAKDLVNFGDFQDALHDENWRLFHSFLSFSLNSKMLSPLEVIKKAEEVYYEKDLPLASVEGFIRQILGWREYIRGVYWANMPGYDQHNFFKHNTKLPDWYWTGKTDMRCLSLSISQSLKNAYAHHIQRLMIIGNFSLLAGLDPKEVHKWYLGIYIDAYEWVEMPNTLGMSQFADGGLLATKPYVSSAAYINKMGNYCTNCKYKLKEKLGEDACPFNSLYWNFFDRHQDKLSNNPRLGIVNSQLKKMDQSQKKEINKKANFYLNNLNSL